MYQLPFPSPYPPHLGPSVLRITHMALKVAHPSLYFTQPMISPTFNLLSFLKKELLSFVRGTK